MKKTETVEQPMVKSYSIGSNATHVSFPDTISSESLTKTMRSMHSDNDISGMIRAAVASGVVHQEVLLEWLNFRTINPVILKR